MEAAVPRASHVNVMKLPSGKALARIDEGEEMTLDGIVWKLLIVLTRDEGVDAGPFVDFKMPEEIRRSLEKLMERKVTQRSIKQNVLRLRNALAEAYYPKDLVEYEKGRGYRFKLLRRPRS